MTETPDLAYAREQRIELRALVLMRLGGLLNVAVGVGTMHGVFHSSPAAVTLAAALFLECVALVAVCYRAGRIAPAWVTVDLVLVVVALVINAHIVRSDGLRNWGFFVYPFSILVALVYGMAYRRLRTTVLAVVVLGAGYAVAAVSAGDRVANVIPNAASYLATGPIVWFIVRELRNSAISVDASRAAAEASAVELAREQERNRNARLLHDRVLQTMELLARNDAPRALDDRLREHVAAEAAWLRDLVETGKAREPGDLRTELDALAAKLDSRGLTVQVTAARLTEPDSQHQNLCATSVLALLDATAEALTNAAKHGRVNTATVHATTDATGVTITVTDAGIGFGTAATRGTGIDRSIVARMAEAGGKAVVHSAAGEGTSVELHMPW